MHAYYTQKLFPIDLTLWIHMASGLLNDYILYKEDRIDDVNFTIVHRMAKIAPVEKTYLCS
jgi:hypothetical protein